MDGRAQRVGGPNQGRGRRHPPHERSVPQHVHQKVFSDVNRNRNNTCVDEDELLRAALGGNKMINPLELKTSDLPGWLPEEPVEKQRCIKGLNKIYKRALFYRRRYLDKRLHGYADDTDECLAIKKSLEMSDKEIQHMTDKITGFGGRMIERPAALDLPLALVRVNES